MKRRKNLERAIVLGLILSTGLYGSAWAEPIMNGANYTDDYFRTAGTERTWDGEGKNITVTHDDRAEGLAFGIWSYATKVAWENSGISTININNMTINVQSYVPDIIDVGNDGSIAVGVIAGAENGIGDENRKAINNINSTGTVTINTLSRNEYGAYGVYAKRNGSVNIGADNGININTSKGLDEEHIFEVGTNDVADVAYQNGAVYGIASENGTTNLNSNYGNIIITSEIADTSEFSGMNGYQEQFDKLQNVDIYAASNTNGTIYLSTGTENATGGVISLSATANKGNAYGLYTQNGKQNNVSGASMFVVNAKSVDGNAYGIYADNDKNNKYNNETNYISGESESGEAYGIYAVNGSEVNITSKGADEYGHGNTITSNKTGILLKDSVLNITAENGGDTLVSGTENGMIVSGDVDAEHNVTVNGNLVLASEEGHALNLKESASMYVDGDQIFNNKITIESNSNEEITGNLISNGIIEGDAVNLKQNAELTVGGNVSIGATGTGLNVEDSKVTVEGNGKLKINSVVGTNGGLVLKNSEVNFSGGSLLVSEKGVGLTVSDNSKFTSNGFNIVVGKTNGIKVVDSSVTLNAGDNYNIIVAGQNGDIGNPLTYTGTAINATNESNGNGENGSIVDVLGTGNNIYGTVRANGEDSVVNIGGSLADGKLTSGANNYIVSSALGVKGSLNENVSSAVYAQNNAKVNIKAGAGQSNYIAAQANRIEGSKTYDERAIWAQGGSEVNIDGETTIIASTAGINILENGAAENVNIDDLENNRLGIAIAAGTGEVEGYTSAEDLINAIPVNIGKSTVELNYTGDSLIYGDIVSAWNGLVNIKSDKNSGSKLNVYGSALAGNGGVLNLDLGNGGVWYGRADDYGDAGTTTEHSNSFFNPAFSNEILLGGEVNLTMGEDSKWYVQGQSWITSINTGETENTVIDLVSANTDRNTTAHALTIGTLTGDTTFKINLDQERANSDMLYIKNANGNYEVNVVDAITTENMYAGGFDGLRFATIGAGSNATFSAYTRDAGAFNVNYLVRTEDYSADDWQNDHYNGVGENDGAASIEKPGNDSVNDFFGETESGGEAETNSIKLMAETENEAAAKVDNTNNQTINIVLYGRIDDGLSDAGKTMLNMSRANYSNAIYMDRLNKRLGEARYINSEDGEGMWVRIRHDRIGKTDAYRSQNTMYELGYDVKQECDNGERRVGMAIDYMHGDTGYSDISGKGEIDRYGLWLYDTWMGDKGHYADYVVKWGHLSNDFELYTMSEHEKVTGDYSNNVFSVSAEYGKKNDMGNGWYIEPQVQAQLARVTGADYVTSQDTKVSVDGINSLIGRAGFRLGKDFGEEKQSTVYIKADVLHEFLGDQDISVMDGTTNGEWAGISYENEGTWYDVGFGFATMMSKNSYAFLDLEKSFGHDNDETYQINAGVQWTF